MEGKDEAGRFLPGNRFWTARSSHGVSPKFETAEQLWHAACEYFDWNADNPLFESKAFAYEGVVSIEPIPKMRAMTLSGLCMFIDVSFQTWTEWRANRPDLAEAIARIEAVIYRQKFEGAAADLLNQAIIARDLGLAEKREVTSPDGSLSPQVVIYALPDNGRG